MNDLTDLGKALAAWKSSYFKMFGRPSYTRDEFVNCLIEGENLPVETDPYGTSDETNYNLDVEGFGEAEFIASNTTTKDSYVIGSKSSPDGGEIWVIFRLNSKYYRVLGTYNKDPSNMYIDLNYGHVWDDVSTVVEVTHHHQVVGNMDIEVFSYEDWSVIA